MTIYDVLTLDIHDFVDKYDLDDSSNSAYSNWVPTDAHWIVDYAKQWLLSQTQEEQDFITALIAQLLIMGAYQAVSVYADFLTFQNRWEAEDYFNAGAFLGKAIIESFVVLFIVLTAVNLRELLQG